MAIRFLILAICFTFSSLAFALPQHCRPATPEQISLVDAGNIRTFEFLLLCGFETGFSPRCSEILVPNIESLDAFHCTYGLNQIHQLLDPDQSTWNNAFQAIQLIQQLEANGIPVCEIYNWWRPEPYNANVGGAPGRHPFGTAVDIRLCSKQDADRAFQMLCKWRDQGQQLRALGYYGTSRLHLGVGDATPNTWGKSCAPLVPQPRHLPPLRKRGKR